MVLKFKKDKPAHADKPQRRYDPPKKHAENEEGWLVSYADMMTLLCGFFIMMFSMAKMDEPQFEKVKEAVAKQFGGDYKSPTQETAKFMTQFLQENGIEKETMLTSDPAGVAIAFQSTMFFDTLGAEIKPQGRALLDKLIGEISTRQEKEIKKYKIVVEGHTDSRPILSGTYPSNWELSSARSSRVVRLFLERGFTPDHMVAIGYADTHPQFNERSPSGQLNEESLAKNRRVVIRILEPKVESIPFPEAPKPEITAAAQTSGPGDGAARGRAPATASQPPAQLDPAEIAAKAATLATQAGEAQETEAQAK